MKRVQVPSYSAMIWIAGDHPAAIEHIERYVQDFPFCVTVTPTTYVHTNGTDPGIIVGLINYPRFPKPPSEVWEKAEQIAAFLCDKLDQQSYTIEASDKTVWFSHRPEDNPASVTGTGTAKTAQPVEGAACQNGPQGDAQDTSPPSSPQAG